MPSSGSSLLGRAYGTTDGGCHQWNYQRWKIGGKEYIVPNPAGEKEPKEVSRIVDQKSTVQLTIWYKDDKQSPHKYTITETNAAEMDKKIGRDRTNATNRQNRAAKKQNKKSYNREEILQRREEKVQKPGKKLIKDVRFEFECFYGPPVVRLLKESVYQKKVKNHKKKGGKGKRKPRQSCDREPIANAYCYCLNKDPKVKKELKQAIDKLIKANRIPCEGQVFESMGDLKNAQFNYPKLERAKNRDKTPRDYWIAWVEDCDEDPVNCRVKTTPPGQETIHRGSKTEKQTAYLKK